MSWQVLGLFGGGGGLDGGGGLVHVAFITFQQLDKWSGQAGW